MENTQVLEVGKLCMAWACCRKLAAGIFNLVLQIPPFEKHLAKGYMQHWSLPLLTTGYNIRIRHLFLEITM